MTHRSRYLHLLLPACAILATLVTVMSVASGAPQRTVKNTAFLGTSGLPGGVVIGLSEGAAGWGGQSTAPRLNSLTSSTGTKWLRDVFAWSKIEPRKGQFRFSYYDHYVLLAARKGLHIVAQLDSTPRWAGSSEFSVPSNPSIYAHYVAAVVHRYGAHGTFWQKYPTLSGSAITTYELWNEPYFDNGNAGHYDPARYANLVKAAGTAGHAADPSSKFLIEAEMEAHLNGVWTWWVDALYHAVPNLNSYFDGVAVHDFGSDTRTLNPIVAGQPYGNFGHIRRIEDLRRQLLHHGAAAKPFWIMETGWSTCTEHSRDCVSAAKQAANFATLFRYLRTSWKGWVRGAFIYRFQDGTQPRTVQGGYGLVHLSGRPKPALRLFKTFALHSGD